MIKKVFFIVFVFISISITRAADDDDDVLGRQKSLNAIVTTVPFLTIAPDSRAGAMGDAGVATSPDLSSQHWNAAKYMFMKERSGIGLSYSPWLKGIGVTDLNLLYLSGYYKFDDRQAISAGLKYFNLGTIDYTTYGGEPAGTGRPNEFALDVGYSRLFSDYFSMALVFRFIYSDIAGSTGSINNIPYEPGISVAADYGIYYQRPFQISKKDAEWAFGLNISNIGTKMSYSEGDKKEFIPTNLRLGGRVSIDLDEYNSLGVALDLNKLLVPTPPVRDPDADSIIVAGKDDDVGTIKGMIQSFYDAPQDFQEEMQEIMFSAGIEYWYRKQFAIRAGYFHEHQKKGNRKYITAGVGLRYNIFSIDFSYLIPTVDGRNSPLANTMRFTLGFTFE
ncbi:MAG: type IX secretion system outer membrane channel protein PorV [Bacteroidales bacterium]|nr:type IX secretion system outer membrane channel protein PorV [Bacteroidales bacterium]